MILKPLLKIHPTQQCYNSSLYSDDVFFKSDLINTINFKNISTDQLLDTVDDSYDIKKLSYTTYHNSLGTLFLHKQLLPTHINYVGVIDNFRSNFEEQN